jgi:NAD(P)-dependent dehydrogenase (short-subunit alcohol dehydrogenase family)
MESDTALVLRHRRYRSALDMNYNLDGKRVIVTGASSGLGRRFATFLAQEGAFVAATARRREALETLAAAPECAGRVTPISMDVADPDSAAAGMEKAVAALGGLDGAVLNAGTAWTGRARDMEDAEWRRVMGVNVDGVFRTAQAAADAMPQGGSIVAIASILAFGTGKRVAAYAASKAAVVQMVRCLALEWGAQGVRVNALAPGYIPTEMNAEVLDGPIGAQIAATVPLGRLGRPEDLDAPLALLLSDAGAYISGVTIPVDGGHLTRPL